MRSSSNGENRCVITVVGIERMNKVLLILEVQVQCSMFVYKNCSHVIVTMMLMNYMVLIKISSICR
jgi:hypothetical protein